MRIIFIDPPDFVRKKNVERVFGCTYSLYPIPNIFSLSNAALLEKNGFEVRYIDMANEGWSQKRFTAFLKNQTYDCYVFHSVNLSMGGDLEAYAQIRGVKENAYIVFTGPAPTYFAHRFVKDERTFVVRGETELALLELMRYLRDKGDLSKIKGLSFKSSDYFCDNPARPLIEDLDSLPHPARHLLNRNLYYNPKLQKRPFTVMQTSRNCSYRCLFCVPNSASFACGLEHRKYYNSNPPVRLRSAENIVAEFADLREKGYKAVSIIDDQFLWQKDRTLKICNGIKELKISWGCLARADHITEDVVKALAQSGCHYVDLGIESFNQEILDFIRKDLRLERVYEARRLLKRHGIMVKINLILGCSPLQTRQNIEEDIRKAKDLDVDAVMFSIATPFPGTEFYELARKNHWFREGDYEAQSVQMKAIINYPHLSSRELDWLVRKANLSFYFGPRLIMKNFSRILRPKGLYSTLRALKRKFF